MENNLNFHQITIYVYVFKIDSDGKVERSSHHKPQSVYRFLLKQKKKNN